MATLISRSVAGTGGAAVDGVLSRTGTDQTLSAIRAGAGTATDATSAEVSYVRLQASTTTDQFQGNVQHGMTFPGLSAAVGGTVTAATLQFYVTDITSYNDLSGNASANSAGVLVLWTPAATNSLENADYNDFGSTEFGRSAKQDTLTAGALNSITINASGLTAIQSAVDGAGIIGLGLVIGWIFDNTLTGLTHSNNGLQGWLGNDADVAVEAKTPVLTITYTPVASSKSPSGGVAIGAPMMY